jgi:uncharacterized protein
MRVVLDTNIIVSALIAPSGPSALALALGLGGQFEICVSPTVLAEYYEVLQRPRFQRLPPRDVQDALTNLAEIGQLFRPTRT